MIIIINFINHLWQKNYGGLTIMKQQNKKLIISDDVFMRVYSIPLININMITSQSECTLYPKNMFDFACVYKVANQNSCYIANILLLITFKTLLLSGSQPIRACVISPLFDLTNQNAS